MVAGKILGKLADGLASVKALLRVATQFSVIEHWRIPLASLFESTLVKYHPLAEDELLANLATLALVRDTTTFQHGIKQRDLDDLIGRA
jgi:hypothetical protein